MPTLPRVCCFQAEEACKGDDKGECATAWDTVEELSEFWEPEAGAAGGSSADDARRVAEAADQQQWPPATQSQGSSRSSEVTAGGAGLCWHPV